MRRVAVAASVLVLLLIPPGCAAPGSTEDGRPSHLDDLPDLNAREDRRIGNRDDPDLGFSRIGDVVVDRDGLVYVMESQALEIRVYHPDGSLVRRIGGPGQGPGEFEWIPSFGVVGDTVWTIDGFLATRLTLFDRSGRVLATGRAGEVRVPMPGTFAFVRPRAMRRDGLFHAWFSGIGGAYGEQAPDVPWSPHLPVPRLLFDIDGSVVDTIAFDDNPPPDMVPPPGTRRETQYVEVGGTRHDVPNPPSERPRWYQSADGRFEVHQSAAVNGDRGELTVNRIGVQGDTVYSVTLAYTPVPYTNAELDSIAGTQTFSRPGRPPDQVDAAAQAAIREAMSFPEYRQPVRYGVQGDDGSFWLRVYTQDEDLATWVILEPSGRARGKLRLPGDAQPRWMRSATAWVNVPDALGIPWLVRYVIEGG